MRPQYLTNWTILYSQSSVNILEPLTSFRNIFLFVALLTFLVVLYMSLSLIRKNLIPIELLQNAIKRIKAKDFESPVHINTNDEFEELGIAFNEMAGSIQNHIETITTINKIGIALSSEKNTEQLMNVILKGAMSIVNADAGFLYSINEDGQAHLSLIYIRSLRRQMSTADCKADSLSYYFCNPRFSELAANSIFNDVTLNIPDIYNAGGLNFSGNLDFDRKTGYRSRSSLSIPMKNHDDKIIGILQLINAQDKHTGEIVPFSDEDQAIAENLASSAAVALTKTQLLEDFKLLFDSMVELIATAIDRKSPYAGGHSRRVPELTMMIAEAVNGTDNGAFTDIRMTSEELYELRTAALLHDCGKLSVPSHIENKSTKLENILDGMQILDARFEVLKRDVEIEYLKKKLRTLKNNGNSGLSELNSKVQKRIAQIEEDKHFLHVCNAGRTPMDEASQKKLKEIARRYTWTDADGTETPVVSEIELIYLSIPRGTITTEERKVINDHVETTAKMLKSLHYPKSLQNVPKFAEVHHERMDGKGYPHGLKRDQIPLQGRIIAIADIFEALTAKDRPYKRRFTLMEALRILGSMKEEGHIDPDLFDIFIKEKIYLRYAEKHLLPEQIDEVVLFDIPGYALVG
jgi:HD-GYP domain-containing protein (c-di-GMP phosphodiesterase class II)/HAMP domain-containing protein